MCDISTGNKNTQDKDDNGIYPFYVRSQKVAKINVYTYEGDAILTAGDGVGVGKVFHLASGKFGVHQRVYMLTGFKCNKNFLFYYFASRFYDRVKRMSAKNSVDSVRMEMISEMPFSLPVELEQAKIGQILSLIDERIALQSKLIDCSKSLMDGIIDKFTTRTPNISIGECLDCYSSTLQEGETEEQGKYQVYGANGVCGYLDYAAISTPAILIVKDGSGVGNVAYTDGNCSVVGTLNYLQPKKGVSAKFLYFVLKRFNFQPYKTGMAIPHLYFKAYSKARIFCPEYEEQSRTAASLSRIEDKIALEERLLSLIQEQKQYLLSAMFI